MSGIFAYIGKESCNDFIIDQLNTINNRGFNTGGIAGKFANSIIGIKSSGDFDQLKTKFLQISCDCYSAICQCSFANRGHINKQNAAPSFNELFAVAVDGNIENFDAVKRWTNPSFEVETDEELVLATLCAANHKNKLDIFKSLATTFEGDPSYVFMANDEDALYCKKGLTPLIIGISDYGCFVCSEMAGLYNVAKKYILLNDGEVAKVCNDKITVFDSKFKRIKKQIQTMPKYVENQNDYNLCDDIFYTPLCAKQTYNSFVKDNKIAFDYLKLSKHNVDKLSRIYLIGCGSSYNVVKMSSINFEMLTDIPISVFNSSEFRFASPIVDKNTLIIAVSSSGETVDTIACIKRVKHLSPKTICVSNNANCELARICDNKIVPQCDVQTSTISTGSFVSSYLTLSLLALYIGQKDSVVTELYLNVALKMAEMLPGKISSAVKSTPQLNMAQTMINSASNLFITGIGVDYGLALESAYKFREIASINASAYPCGEMAHSFYRIITPSTVIVALISNKDMLQKTLIKLRDLKAIGANILILTTTNIEEEIKDFDNIVSFNDSIPIFNPISIVCGLYKIATNIQSLSNEKSEKNIQDMVS